MQELGKREREERDAARDDDGYIRYESRGQGRLNLDRKDRWGRSSPVTLRPMWPRPQANSVSAKRQRDSRPSISWGSSGCSVALAGALSVRCPGSAFFRMVSARSSIRRESAGVEIESQ